MLCSVWLIEQCRWHLRAVQDLHFEISGLLLAKPGALSKEQERLLKKLPEKNSNSSEAASDRASLFSKLLNPKLRRLLLLSHVVNVEGVSQRIRKPLLQSRQRKQPSLQQNPQLPAAKPVAQEAAKPGRRPYKKPTVTKASGARAAAVLTAAGLSVPKLAADRIKKANEFLQKAKGKGKGKGGKEAADKAPEAAAKPKGPSVADQKSAIAKMTDAQLTKALKAGGFKITKIGPGTRGSGTVSRAKAIQKLQGRVNKAGRAEKAAASGKPSRPQRRNQKQKDTETKAETQKAEAPKAAKAAPAAEKGVNLAAELGYRSKAKQEALNKFFESRKVSTLSDLIENKEALARALGAVRGGTNKVASGKGLLKNINKISNVRGKGGAGSPIPKARDATGARVAQGRARDRSVAEVEERVAERAARAVRDKAGPVLRGITSNPIKGTKALFTKLAQGKISPAQMKKQLDPILAKATKAQKADFNRALDFFTRMQINMRAAKKAGKVRPEDTKALKNAEKQLRQMLATIALAAGMGAAAE